MERFALPAAQIEGRSFEIIESLLPSDLACTAQERQIIKRIVHTSGDPQVASLVRIHPAAVDAGLTAIRIGATIFTDVQMAAAGVNRRLTEKFDCRVQCALTTEGVDLVASRDGTTRATAAIRLLGAALDGGVVAIGNAPTALLALLDLVDQGLVRPALVVGVPVGFVGAAEAKQELLIRSQIPSISIEGFRGGSTLAAAIVNALLMLA
ncbi:MAG: precorrin isomerase [Chloroflexota bacterium]|nr:MAG: precorrin isomerase [Chloroflexota bacterium]